MDLIKKKTVEALRVIDKCRVDIPEKFEVEIEYKNHEDAYRASYYPGVKRVSSKKVKYTAGSVKEMIVTNMFIM